MDTGSPVRAAARPHPALRATLPQFWGRTISTVQVPSTVPRRALTVALNRPFGLATLSWFWEGSNGGMP